MSNKLKNKPNELEQLDVSEVLEKYDKESATRKTGPLLTKFITIMLFVWGSWQLYTAFFGEFPSQLQRVIHLGFVLPLVFLMYPANKKGKFKLAWYDVILALLGALVAVYYCVEYQGLMFRDMAYNQFDIVVAAIAIVLVLEAARRILGVPILIIICTFLLFAYFGKYMPGFFRHRGVRFERLVSAMFFTTEGILGVPLGVSATFIFLFIMFGSFLEKTGIGRFFIDLGNAVAGGASGGPAKVAVISSALEGTISGSSVANVAGSGSFTIPMMKKLGYSPEFAGAVEASASTGGQIMPPVMGAAAFLMCEFLGIPYATVAKAAIIPAILYFTGVFLGVHFEARKLGLKGMAKSELPSLFVVLRAQGQLLLPIFGMIFFLSSGMSAMRAALLGIIASVLAGSTRRDYDMEWDEVAKWESRSFRLLTGTIIAFLAGLYVANSFMKVSTLDMFLVTLVPTALYFGLIALLKGSSGGGAKAFLLRNANPILPVLQFAIVYAIYNNMVWAVILGIIAYFFVNVLKGEPQIHFTKLLQAVVDGAKGALGVAVACAGAGMIVGVVTMTGLGLKLGNGLVDLANNELLLTMVFTMITSLILGMGVPTTANYVITSTIAAPAIIALIGQGQALAAHMFVFYFGIIADVTPPVALAAFTGAGIAHGNPMQTGVQATKLSIAAWLVPYCFVYNTNLLMTNASFFSFVTIFNLVTAFVGMYFIAVGVQGWLKTYSPAWERVIAIIAGLAMIGGSRFFHGVLEIFRGIGNFGQFITNNKDFFYSMKGEYAVNGFGLVLIVLIYLLQTQRKKKYGDMSIKEIFALAKTK